MSAVASGLLRGRKCATETSVAWGRNHIVERISVLRSIFPTVPVPPYYVRIEVRDSVRWRGSTNIELGPWVPVFQKTWEQGGAATYK